MQNLKITCNLINGVATTDGYLPLDGILASLWMRENRPDLYYNTVVTEIIHADLPLKRIDNGNGWYYACSFAEVEWQGGETHHWHKRNTSLEQMRYVGKGELNLAQGKTKAYRMPLFISHAKTLTWYAVGDATWLTERLPMVTSIGKKRNTGHGMVANWQVEIIEQDYNLSKDSKLMRSVPRTELPPKTLNFRLGSYGLRPPYWHYENQAVVALPIMEMVNAS